MQQAKQWPGLSVEVREICTELGIPDINMNNIPAEDIGKAVLEHHNKELVEEVLQSKKMKEHKNDNFKHVQEYFKDKSLYNCRMAFRIRSEMVKDIKGNFSDKYRRKGVLMLSCVRIAPPASLGHKATA